MTPQAPRARLGRPPIHGGVRMVSRTIQLPETVWLALERDAARAQVSVAALVRRKLGVRDATSPPPPASG